MGIVEDLVEIWPNEVCDRVHDWASNGFSGGLNLFFELVILIIKKCPFYCLNGCLAWQHPSQTLGNYSPTLQPYSRSPSSHNGQVSSLLLGGRWRRQFQVVLSLSVLSSSSLPAASLLSFFVSLSSSSMPSHSSRFQFPSTAIAIWLHGGSDLIITLLQIALPATKVWHCLGHTNPFKFASIIESTSRREICWKSNIRCLGKCL